MKHAHVKLGCGVVCDLSFGCVEYVMVRVECTSTEVHVTSLDTQKQSNG